MKTLANEMILASAGSGKTFALTDRFVQLLALGAPPERIVALTFTRKAAAEFFDEILGKLARAATDAREARRIAEAVGRPELDTAAFTRLLRSMVNAMHRLTLGTFDGFFSRIVRAFPMELGIDGEFDLLQAHAAWRERRRVLQRLFARGAAQAREARREFIEAFKRATFGVEEKQLAARLDRFIDEHHEVYLSVPDTARWGNPGLIWPEGCEWLQAVDVDAAVNALRRLIDDDPAIDAGPRGRWAAFFAELPTWLPGAKLPPAVAYLLGNALKVWPALKAGNALLTVERKKQRLSAEQCVALRRVVQGIVGAEFMRRLLATQGLGRVLRGYEDAYERLVRRAGRLTFADVQRLLTADRGAPILTTGGEIAAADRDERRLSVDWRLDARFDHWMLDEFQDTSYAQWSVLRPLIDEVVQDPEGRRSFFYVGDVKQAIYAWRGGDARLFTEIEETYNAMRAGSIERRYLDESWRSCASVLALVNRVFGGHREMAGLYPESAVTRWAAVWRPHRAARTTLVGQAAWLIADDEAAQLDITRRVLGEIDPLARGLSVAVLVQGNSLVHTMADYLRREGGFLAVAESDEAVCVDNPLGGALLALCQMANCPGDRFALEHVRMTPLADCIDISTTDARDGFTRRFLGELQERGFEAALAPWAARLVGVSGEAAAFARLRARQFLDAARRFDAQGGRDVAEFIAFMGKHTIGSTETAGVVRVMTIHKSKGLGFDVVILPDLEGQKLAQARDGLMVERAADRQVRWVLDLPTRDYVELDPVLAPALRAAEADGCYEKIALFYVALTRAKQGLYLITKNPAKSSSCNFPKLLGETLGLDEQAVSIGAATFPGFASEGDGRWFETGAGKATETQATGLIGLEPLPTAVRRGRLQARTASGAERELLPGRFLFGEAGSHAVDFGVGLHRVFASIDWWDSAERAVWAAARRAEGISEALIAEAEACLQAPELGAVFRRPDGVAHSEVWRERAFEWVDGGVWISGTFDRVVVALDARGHAIEAWVYDFKTDRSDGSAASERQLMDRYAPQLETYRRVVARLAGLGEGQVRCALVLTGPRRVVWITG